MTGRAAAELFSNVSIKKLLLISTDIPPPPSATRPSHLPPPVNPKRRKAYRSVIKIEFPRRLP
ncbi:hypothetical protein GWI33_021964, partial [Rhynchophorus ferrugineus]